MEDGRLAELLVDRPELERSVGNIYHGRVDAVLPGMQAAFIDIGMEKSAFLHASDLIEPDDPEFEDDDGGAGDGNGGSSGGNGGGSGRGRFSRKVPNIQDQLSRGQNILVQVTKEPISTKGCRVTAQISLPGRNLVFLPFASKVGVSRKIVSRESRVRLRNVVRKELAKESGGVICRTASEKVSDDDVARELKTLLEQWKTIKAKGDQVKPPALVQREASLTHGIIRDLFSDKIDGLYVDSRTVLTEVKDYLKEIDPDLIKRVNWYRNKQVSLFDRFEIEVEVENLFKKRVDLPTGGYVIIEQTEALVSIDVNTGSYTGRRDPEQTIFKTNMEAAREIARQLRLRDIGGIIVIDFIDMERSQNREKLFNEVRSAVLVDRARTKIFRVSDLGLIEMTRQRVRPSLRDTMTSICPSCQGMGRVFRPEVVARHLDRSLKRVANDKEEKQVLVRLHPEVALYLFEDEPEFLKQVMQRSKVEIIIRDDPTIALDEFRLVSQPAGRDVTEKYAAA